MLDNPITRIIVAVILTTVIFTLALTFLPTWALPGEVELALDWLFTSIWKFNFMIPVSTLIMAFTVIITLDMAFMGFKFVMFLKKHYTQQH